jgi:hypothetical protein
MSKFSGILNPLAPGNRDSETEMNRHHAVTRLDVENARPSADQVEGLNTVDPDLRLKAGLLGDPSRYLHRDRAPIVPIRTHW